jgi:hypothetical protein
VLAVVGLSLVLALAPSAWSLQWIGGAVAGSSGWSLGSNWAGVPPSLSEPFRLEFPRLLSPACTTASPSDTCYVSKNDVGDVAVESLRVDDGDEYELEGDGITLGSEGLAAAPASGTSGPDGDFIGLPITLGASQPWSISGRSGGGVGENGVFVEGSVTGSNQNLAVDIEHGAALYLANSTEVGSLTFAGANAGEAGVLNGFVGLLGAQVNSSDANGVALSHVLMIGSGSVGALTTSDAELGVGSGHPTGEIQARSVTLDAGSEVEFEITGSGTIEGVDYGQLSSGGAVALGGASLSVFVGPTSGTKCPTPEPGQKYTLVSTSGTLSGSFANAPEGIAIPVVYAKSCATHSSTYLRIAYHESGGTQTVTATVTGGSGGDEESPWVAEAGALAAARQLAASEAARKAREAEQRALAAQAHATSGSDVLLASTNVAIQRDGTALVKLYCKGSASCGGKLTLSAQATSKAKGKRKRTITIGTAGFSVSAGETATVKVKLNAAGRRLLGAAHGHLNAHLAIVQSTPGPTQTQTKSVHLLQQRARNSRDGGSKK